MLKIDLKSIHGQELKKPVKVFGWVVYVAVNATDIGCTVLWGWDKEKLKETKNTVQSKEIEAELNRLMKIKLPDKKDITSSFFIVPGADLKFTNLVDMKEVIDAELEKTINAAIK